jgi:hypothetical protein
VSYSREDLLAAIELALKERDMPAVVALLKPLAVVAPHDAQAILDAVQIAQFLRR